MLSVGLIVGFWFSIYLRETVAEREPSCLSAAVSNLVRMLSAGAGEGRSLQISFLVSLADSIFLPPLSPSGQLQKASGIRGKSKACDPRPSVANRIFSP